MKKKTNLLARAALTLLLAVLGSVGAWAQDEAANEPVIASKSPAAIAFLNMFFINVFLL